MKKEEAKKRLEKLKEEIDYHRYQYHVLDQESIDPNALDSLKKELVDIETKFPDLISPDSPSQRVAGKALDKFKKIKHERPMTSLNDAFNLEDLKAWEKRNFNLLAKKNVDTSLINYWAELKLDGLAVSLVYNNLNFKYGATRGDGFVGEDISNNLKTIRSIALKIKLPAKKDLIEIGLTEIESQKMINYLKYQRLELRGEVVMPISVFKQINQINKEKGLPLLANTRNGAAGSLRQLNSQIAASRNLSFFAYDILFNDQEITDIIDTRLKLEKFISILGFKIVEDNKLFNKLSAIIAWQEIIRKKRNKFDFEIDGIVIKINQHKYWPILGIVGKAPRYMIAFKFPAIQTTTKLKKVDWQVGRSGALTPIAILETVNIAGANVSRASLHNYEEIKRLDLKIGDTVIVERAGDVIPKVVKVLKGLRDGQEKNIDLPSFCPRCLGKLERNQDMATYRCVNKECQEVALRRLIHFVSKSALDIEGLGEKIVILLFKKNLIKTADDFFRLNKADLLNLEGFKEKKVNKVLEAIEKKKKIELSRFIKALSISQIGEVSANKIADIYSQETKNNLIKPSALLNWAKQETYDDWLRIDDVGEIVAKSLVDFWKSKSTEVLLLNLEKLGIRLEIEKSVIASEFKGKTFVLTGKLNSLTRQEAKDRIKRVGGEIKSQVTKNLDYLIVGDEPGEKFNKAQELKINILNEEEFLNKIV
jgi:DNA ligase (NAD+)